MKHAHLLLLPVLAASSSAAAAGPPPALQPVAVTGQARAEAHAAALALFDGMDLKDQLLASGLHMMKAAIDARTEKMRAEGVELPPSLDERLRTFMYEQMRQMVDKLMPTYRAEVAAVYVRYFTAAELRELKRLRETPVMKKVQHLTPVLSGELSKIGLRVAAERSSEMERKSKELVEKWLAEEAMVAQGPRT